jgi:hypothetical protein
MTQTQVRHPGGAISPHPPVTKAALAAPSADIQSADRGAPDIYALACRFVSPTLRRVK